MHCQDIEDEGNPPVVERIRAAVQQADALLIATCEYNGASVSVFAFVQIDRTQIPLILVMQFILYRRFPVGCAQKPYRLGLAQG